MEFSRPQYWSWLWFPSPGDLPDGGIEPKSPTLQVDSLPGEPQGLHEKSMLTLRGNDHTSSQSGCPILHLFSQCVRVLTDPHP